MPADSPRALAPVHVSKPPSHVPPCLPDISPWGPRSPRLWPGRVLGVQLEGQLLRPLHPRVSGLVGPTQKPRSGDGHECSHLSEHHGPRGKPRPKTWPVNTERLSGIARTAFWNRGGKGGPETVCQWTGNRTATSQSVAVASHQTPRAQGGPVQGLSFRTFPEGGVSVMAAPGHVPSPSPARDVSFLKPTSPPPHRILAHVTFARDATPMIMLHYMAKKDTAEVIKVPSQLTLSTEIGRIYLPQRGQMPQKQTAFSGCRMKRICRSQRGWKHDSVYGCCLTGRLLSHSVPGIQ